jgi:glycosyltransferase 2 family protein
MKQIVHSVSLIVSRKRVLKVAFRFLQVSVSIGLIYYLVKLVDWSTVQSLERSGIIYKLWPGIIILCIGICLAASRWHQILNGLGIEVTWWHALCMYFSGIFYSVILPGVLGGDVVRAGLCAATTRGSMSKIFISVGLERILGIFGLTLLGSAAVICLNHDFRDALGTEVNLICPILAACMVLVFGILHFFLPFITSLSKRYTGWGAQWLALLTSLAAPIRTLSPRLLITTLLLGTAFQASEILVFIIFSKYLQIDVPPILFFAVVPIVYIATVLPVSLGGIGVREGVLVWLLTKVGGDASDAVLLAFLIYLNRVIVSLIGGIIQWLHPSFKRKKRL